MWLGYGENIRAIKWALERVTGEGKYVDTPIGRLPEKGAFDVEGLDIPNDSLNKLFMIDKEQGLKEVEEMREYYKIFGDKLPAELTAELNETEKRLKA